MKAEMLELRSRGYTYQSIAMIFSTNKGLVWKICNTEMNIVIHSKPRFTNRQVFPFWQFSSNFQELIKKACRRFYSENNILFWELRDYLTDWALARKKADIFEGKPEKYFYRVFIREAIRKIERQKTKVYLEKKGAI
jgi:hypothetical protein